MFLSQLPVRFLVAEHVLDEQLHSALDSGLSFAHQGIKCLEDVHEDLASVLLRVLLHFGLGQDLLEVLADLVHQAYAAFDFQVVYF